MNTRRTLASLIAGLSLPLQAAEQSAEQAAPRVLAGNDITAHLLQTSLGLLVVLAVIVAAAWGVKRFGKLGGSVQGRLKVVGGVALGGRERVVLLQVGEEQLVLGVAPGQIRTLHVLSEPLAEVPLAGTRPAEESFAQRLQTAIKGGRSQ